MAVVLVLWSALAATLIALLIVFAGRFRGPVATRQFRALLVGPSGSGKTALFAQWTGAPAKGTVTSVLPYLGELDANDERPKLTLVDLPGHEKLTHYTFDQLGKRCNAIIFVVDAASGPEGIKKSAHRLYQVLVRSDRQGVPVLVAANKNDLFHSLSVKRVTLLLENAIEELRQSRVTGVGEVGDDDDEVPWLGLNDKFSFQDLESPVTVLDGSVRSNKTQKWQDWLAAQAAA